jgi:hypothetical protein
MDSYRLFFVERGKIGSAQEFEASSDRIAISHAEGLRAGRAAELWSRARQVLTFAQDGAAAPP